MVYKQGGKRKPLPKKYVPDSLTEADKKKQEESIRKGTMRPKLKSFKSKRSSHVKKFEEKYGFKITDKRVEEIISREGINQILSKGKGAYFGGGSRPNQTPSSWAYARLASVIMNGKARDVDRDIWNKYKK